MVTDDAKAQYIFPAQKGTPHGRASHRSAATDRSAAPDRSWTIENPVDALAMRRGYFTCAPVWSK
jgi:hypothetical protein